MQTLIFTDKELQYLQDQDFLLTKIQIIEKISEKFADLREDLKNRLENTPFQFPPEMDIKNGKISKGEKYQNLPYLVLDFPKLFQKQAVFSFRTILWWANEFSFTLHLQGVYQAQLKEIIARKYSLLADNQVFIGVNDSPWEYDFTSSNYLLIEKISANEFQKICLQHPFLKLSRRLPLENYEKLNTWTVESFQLFLKSLT